MTSLLLAYVRAGFINRITQTSTITSTVVTTYTYDAANRLTKVGNVYYTWYDNGNLANDGDTFFDTLRHRLMPECRGQ